MGPESTGVLRGAAPVGGGKAWPGFEIDHSEPKARGRRAGGPPPTAHHAARPGKTWPGFETTRRSPAVWRAPYGLLSLAAVHVGGGRAWPGFETTRRAKLAARTASGRAAAHGHQQADNPLQLGALEAEDVKETTRAIRGRVREELARRVNLDDAALVHEDDAVGDRAGETHLVRDDEHRHAGAS